MKLRASRIGGLVLIYGLFHAGVVFDLVNWLAQEEGGGGDLPTLGRLALGLGVFASLVAGGAGFALGKPWGKWLALAGLAMSLLVRGIGMLEVSRQPGRGNLLASEAMAAVPAALLIVGVLVMDAFSRGGASRTTEGGVTLPLPKLSRLDLAYASYLGVDLLLLVVLVGAALDLGESGAAYLGMLVAVPLGMATAGGVLFGIVLSCLHWREWPLPMMAAMTLASPFVAEASGEWNLISERVGWALGAVYVLVVNAFGIRWFLWRRRRAPALGGQVGIGPERRGAGEEPRRDSGA